MDKNITIKNIAERITAADTVAALSKIWDELADIDELGGLKWSEKERFYIMNMFAERENTLDKLKGAE